MKTVTIVGARPQFIKAALVCKALRKAGHHDFIVHTGQHYDFKMSQVFFDELEIPQPDVNMNVGSGPHGWQTGQMLIRLEQIISDQHPNCAIVYGDTNTTLAGALAASKLHVPVVHVEAGLRSHNKWMPEEQNRILTDHLSSVLFCPTQLAVDNLLKEGFAIQRPVKKIDQNLPIVIRSGDVMYDCALFYLNQFDKKLPREQQLSFLNPSDRNTPYLLCTIHRAENTESTQRMHSILSALNQISHQIKIILPLHPRTRHVIYQNDDFLNLIKPLVAINPVTYPEMLALEKHSAAVCTDSGGVQKEAYFFKKPCITLREETEWVETVHAGWNRVAGTDTDEIVSACRMAISFQQGPNRFAPFLDSPVTVENQSGYGNTAESIVKHLSRFW